jgi:RyR domain/MerR family regulatory protein
MDRYITTGPAARALGISTATLTRWAAAGLVTPAERTAGGHYRWDLTALRAEVRRLPGATLPREPRTYAEDIARVVHAANRELQIVQGDPRPSPPWDEITEAMVRDVTEGVLEVLGGATPEQSHEAWCDRHRADGWTYGEVKDEQAKTHPLLRPWAELPRDQQLKDNLFGAIVRALAPEAE